MSPLLQSRHQLYDAVDPSLIGALAAVQALEALGEVQQLSRRCFDEYADRGGGGSGGGNGHTGGGGGGGGEGDPEASSRSSSVNFGSFPRGTSYESTHSRLSSAPHSKQSSFRCCPAKLWRLHAGVQMNLQPAASAVCLTPLLLLPLLPCYSFEDRMQV